MSVVAQTESPHRTRSSPWTGTALLAATAALWGSTFIFVQDGVRALSPAAVNFGRFAIAAVALAPFLRRGRGLWLAAGELGFWLWAGYATQAVGLQYTDVNRSAFLTAMSVVLVPVLAAVAGKRVPWVVWLAAGAAMAGSALLTNDRGRPNVGDLWTVATAVVFAFYIYRLERHAGAWPSLPLAAAQMVTITLLCAAWIAEERLSRVPWRTQPHVPWVAILYLGLAATALTTWTQALGQRSVPAPQAAVLFTLEPVWAAVFAFLWKGDMLGPVGWAGAALIVVGAIASQTAPGPSATPAAPAPAG